MPNKGTTTSAFSRVATLNPLGDDLFDGEEEDSEEEEEKTSRKGGAAARRRRENDKSAEAADTPKTGGGGHQILRRQDQRYKEIKRQLARRAKARREDKSAIEE